MDPEERKIAALIAAFDTEHERVKGAITALNQTGAQLKRDVTGAAAGAVTAALAELNQEIQNAGRTLKQLQRFSLWHTSLRHLMVAIAAIAVTLIAVWWYVPDGCADDGTASGTRAARGLDRGFKQPWRADRTQHVRTGEATVRTRRHHRGAIWRSAAREGVHDCEGILSP